MKPHSPSRRRAVQAAVLALAAPLFALAVPTAAQHEHGHAAGPRTLELDHGRKWATDAPLREGMSAIRDAIAADHHAIHTGAETAAQSRALAAGIDERIARIVKNCKLAPAADAQLHLVLSDIIAGSEAMKGDDAAKGREGAVKIIGALQAYPRYFDHPGWRALD